MAALCIVGAVVALPRAAWACPQCALGRDAGAVLDLLVLGILVAPFAVVAFAVRAIARIVKPGDCADGEEGAPEEGREADGEEGAPKEGREKEESR